MSSEKLLVDLLVYALESDDLAAFGATTVEQGQQLADMHAPNLVILDSAASDDVSFMNWLRTRNPPIGGIILGRNEGMGDLVDGIRKLLHADLPSLPGGNGIRILVTDDEAEIRDMIAEFLKAKGYSVVTAKNGREAVERVQSDPSIRVALLDVSMPGMGGMEALSTIMSLTAHPSVIMITAIADRAVAQQAIKTGAFDYVLKPFDFPTVENSLAACLSQSEYGRQPWWKRLGRR